MKVVVKQSGMYVMPVQLGYIFFSYVYWTVHNLDS